MANGAGELGLIVPGLGLEHFMDLYMDAKDAEAGLSGGTPRTIEGPLYVSGAPLVENGANLSSDPDPDHTDHCPRGGFAKVPAPVFGRPLGAI